MQRGTAWVLYLLTKIQKHNHIDKCLLLVQVIDIPTFDSLPAPLLRLPGISRRLPCFSSTSFSFKFPCSRHSELKPQGEELTGWATAASRRWNPTALSNPDKAHFVGHKQLSIHTYIKTLVILKVPRKLMFWYGVSTTLIRKLGKFKSRKLIVNKIVWCSSSRATS